MMRLNATAAAAMTEMTVDAATDITGFGLLGHLSEMVRAAHVGAVVSASSVPLLPGTREMLAAGHVPGGSRRNLESLSGRLLVAENVSPEIPLLLADAQTSGGLLIAVPAAHAAALCAALLASGDLAAKVGKIIADHPGLIEIVP